MQSGRSFLRSVLNKDTVFVLIVVLLSAVLLFAPTGYESHFDSTIQRPRGRIVDVNNSLVKQFGLVREGSQLLRVRILDGAFAGLVVDASNTLIGKFELDKVFRVGDTAIMLLNVDGDSITSATAYDQYRIDTVIVLLGLFTLFLIGFAGWTGVRALLSFFFTALIIWKALLPGILHGLDPILLSLAVVSVLIAATVFLVAGLNKKAVVALLGALLGILVTCVLALLFYGPFHVHGAVLPFSETLLYSGFVNLDLTRIFLAGIFISAAGALMDLSMDISSAMSEVMEKKPGISRREAIGSGLAVGRVVTGTMITTLLLAYTGVSSTMLMLFMGQGIPLENMLNINYIAAEILKTMVGSFGLVTVAPFTALVGGLLYVPWRRHR